MGCSSCSSKRVASVYSHASDLHSVQLTLETSDGVRRVEHQGYLPWDLGIGGGDDTQFEFCLDCGQIQGKFPLPLTCLEQGKGDY